MVPDRPNVAHRSVARGLRVGPSSGLGWRSARAFEMAVRSTLRAQALLEFELPSAPQRADELFSGLPGLSVWRIQAPAGRFLLVCAEAALALAFEATLFDLLAESRYPAPRPRRARGGSLIAVLGSQRAASCYAWPPGETVDPREASVPQLMEVGRLLARPDQLGETHPASVAPSCDGAALLLRCPKSAHRDELQEVISSPLPRLPIGAGHGGLTPARAL